MAEIGKKPLNFMNYWPQQGILTRLFGDPASLRFGLPGNEQAWLRLETALRHRQIQALCLDS